jgi:hypothetical protein
VLALRPTCENCNTALPPDSQQARICSFECTFCAPCVETVLQDICPNCGGGFAPRPIRPAHDWRAGNHLGRFPADSQIRHRPADLAEHARLSAAIGDRPPHAR